MTRLLTGMLAVLFSMSAIGEAIPVGDFSKPPEYYDAVLSPDGKHIAIERSADEGKQLVAIVATDSLKLISYIPATTGTSPFRPVWANNERIVVSFTESSKRREHEWFNGELMSMDFDGKTKAKIVQHQQSVSNGSNKPLNALHGRARVEHLLPKEKDYVLIKFDEFGFSRVGSIPELYKIHLKRGRIKLVTKAPSYAANFTYSPNGEPVYSIGIDKKNVKNENAMVIHKYEGKTWVPMPELNLEAEEYEVVAQTNNPEEVYIRASYLDTPDKLYRYNMETGEKKLIFFHPKVNWSSLDLDRETNELIAVHFEAGYPDIQLINTDHLYSKWYPSLFSLFDGLKVRITSASDDGSQLIVHVSGANEPGQFHLFNTKTKKLTYLFNAGKWIDAKNLAETKPFTMKARDGLELQGYLTEPRNANGKRPLVVMPHGGPHGPRDHWSYNSEVQFLASRGYAVLQINFRGSGGFGLGFERMGYKKWGSDIQYDIIDATRWAMKKETIDGDRVCIMGGSFGGYSALMSPTIEPDLYKCAIGFVGVYDLELMWKTGDIETHKLGENYLEEVVGSDKDILKQFSPINRVDKLKAPVFLIHGEKDWRVDVKHFHLMKKALEEKKHPLETMLVEKEGHGFASEENRTQFLMRVEAFLNKYIGDSAKP